MIDINKAKDFYKEYISEYSLDEPRIALKVDHIYRTAKQAKWLAESLELSKEDLKLLDEIENDLKQIDKDDETNSF